RIVNNLIERVTGRNVCEFDRSRVLGEFSRPMVVLVRRPCCFVFLIAEHIGQRFEAAFIAPCTTKRRKVSKKLY
ncbi:hypothetical protein OAF09_02095, partial [bacterium]|nr:hypothetical protein [bacterium]